MNNGISIQKRWRITQSCLAKFFNILKRVLRNDIGSNKRVLFLQLNTNLKHDKIWIIFEKVSFGCKVDFELLDILLFALVFQVCLELLVAYLYSEVFAHTNVPKVLNKHILQLISGIILLNEYLWFYISFQDAFILNLEPAAYSFQVSLVYSELVVRDFVIYLECVVRWGLQYFQNHLLLVRVVALIAHMMDLNDIEREGFVKVVWLLWKPIMLFMNIQILDVIIWCN